ncbi:unnamed protein product [Phytomonas sp. EM1]|nr:unnamed protein product [Phytomonas sp. EM1]|eukprot:CCW60428.1 unnamed protein product [Phytomonas sp. isolate EM1]
MSTDLGRSFAAVAVCGCGHEGRLGLSQVANTENITLLGDFLPVGEEEKTPGVQSAPCGEVLRIHCGGYHTIVITTTGVYGWGMNDCGQLGLGRGVGTDAEGTFFGHPTRLKFFDGMIWNSKHQEESHEEAGSMVKKESGEQEYIVQIACGALHSMALTNRALYACGKNEFGQLGLGHDEENVSEWTRVCSHGCGDVSARCNGVSLDNDMSLIMPFGTDSSIIRGVITNVSCGTHHTLLAWRDVLLTRRHDGAGVDEAHDVSSTQRIWHDNDHALRGYFYHPTLIMAAGKGDYGELGYDEDLHAALRSRDKRVQGALWREALVREEQFQGCDVQGEYLKPDANGSGYSEPTHMQKKMFNKNPCAGWIRKQKQQQRRPEFYSANFKAVNFELLKRCAVALPTALSPQNGMATPDTVFDGGNPSNRFRGVNMPSEYWEVVQLQAMHLHSSATLRKCVTPTETGDRSADGQHPDTEDMQTYHWGCYFCGEIEGNETSVPRLLDGKAGTTIHAGSEILFRHRLSESIGSPCSVEKRGSMEDAPPGHLSAREEVFVLGQGTIGLGSDDSFQKIWAPIPGTMHVAAKIVGRTHFLMLLRDAQLASDATNSCGDLILGFGDNLNGQIGCAYDLQNGKGGPQSCYSGNGARKDSVEVLSPRHVLGVGDVLLAAPTTSLSEQLKQDCQPRGRENVNQRAHADYGPSVWVVDQIIDVGAGVRHSIVLVNVHLEKKKLTDT